MAALTSTVTPTHRIQHERFTTEQHGYELCDLSPSLTGNIAVCGRHDSSGRTFIDLYFRRNSDSRDKLKLFYSKEFEKYSHYSYPCISFFEDGSQIVSCIDDKIEIIDTKNKSKVLRSCRVNGKIWCVAVREGEIFIGLRYSQTLIVFNNDLKETKKIILKGIQDGGWPDDLQVVKDTVFVSTVDSAYSKAYAINERRVISEFTDSTGKYGNASSLAVSESLGLVAVVWDWCRIIVYSLNENKSFLVFDDNSGNVWRIRISDRDRMMITGNYRTGEIKMYDLNRLFTFEAMKRTLAYTVTPNECEKLRKHYEISEDELSQVLVGAEESDEMSDEESEEDETFKRMECLLTVIEKKGHLDPYNINDFKDAVAAIGDEMLSTNLQGPVEGYILHGSLKVKYEDLAAVMMTRQKAWEDEKNHLRDALKTAKTKENEYEKTIKDKEDELQKIKNQSEEQEQSLKSQLEKTKQSLESSRVELEQIRTTSSKTIETLTKELTQTQKESGKHMEVVKEELKETKQSLELSRRESAKQIEVLTSELKQTRTESAKQIEILTADLEQTRTDPVKEMEIVKEELKDTKKSLELSRAELDQTRTTSSKTIETLTKELTQTQTESEKQMEKVKEKLKDTKHSLESSRAESTKQIDTLELQLNQLKQKMNSNTKEKETLCRDLEITKQVLEQTKQDRDGTRTELERYQLEFAKEAKALKEVLNQTREAMNELQKQTVEDKPLDNSEKAKDEDASHLAAEFGRLMVSVAEYLTLDDCLKLATLCDVSPAECDIVRRISFIETPGIKFLDILKQRGFINMFDVTNLQKALAMLELETVNQNAVVPYQEKIDEERYEQYKLEEIFTWDDVTAYLSSVKENTTTCQLMRENKIQNEDDMESENTSQSETKASQLEADVEDRGLLLKDRHQFYTECSIGREGGTIQIANASLTIPPDALHESHVIALTVMNESPFFLDREVDTARMTPLIKLEPLGLEFKKFLQLNIPHSALISEPHNHNVIIYSGQMSKVQEDSSGHIQWTVERFLKRQLMEKSVTVDIQCLSYLLASLVSQTVKPPLYIVRAVLFVDGIRNAEDDITLTVCFCNDNDTEYNMLLSDYKSKLPLEQYSTLQLHRHSESDEDDAGYLSVTVTSVNNTYVPDADQAVKRFAVAHLCTASRVSHQLRLKRNRSAARNVVDITLTFSQAQYESTKMSLKARINDMTISEENETLLTGSHPTGNETYKEMVDNVSSNLGFEQCRELATHFELALEETEMIISNQDPGKMLMKTLEDRSMMDSQKMFQFFEGLKACHLDKAAELVLEYVRETSKQTRDEQKLEEDKKIKEIEGATVKQHLLKKGQKMTHSSVSDQSVQTTLSSSCVSSNDYIKTLTNEGYCEHKAIEALDISRNRPVMARKVLQVLEEPFEKQPKQEICLHREQYIGTNGDDIHLQEASACMVIPAGALSEGSIISITLMTSKQGNITSEGRTPQLTPVIKCGPESLTLNKPVTVRFPHCAPETDGITSTDLRLGFSGDGETGIHWRKRKQHEPAPVLKKDHFEVFLTQFCAISLNIAVDYKKPMAKRLRALPVITRIANPSDDFTVTLWIYNDDETEHMHLLYEEINVEGKIQRHDFQSFTIKSPESDKEFHIKSESNTLTPRSNMKKILSSELWYNSRSSVKFHFQNKEGSSDISFKLRICKKQLLLRLVDELQFDLEVKLDQLQQKNEESMRALLQRQELQPEMRKSFEELVSKLSEQLTMDSCLEIAGMFRLSADFTARMKESTEPGQVLFDELIHEQLITAASVSVLDVALSKTGNIHLAKHVKEYRMRNATFPTRVFMLF